MRSAKAGRAIIAGAVTAIIAAAAAENRRAPTGVVEVDFFASIGAGLTGAAAAVAATTTARCCLPAEEARATVLRVVARVEASEKRMARSRERCRGTEECRVKEERSIVGEKSVCGRTRGERVSRSVPRPRLLPSSLSLSLFLFPALQSTGTYSSIKEEKKNQSGAREKTR